MKKVNYPINKRKWHPSLIPGPIVLISTYNSKKEPNIAPKSWIQMVAFDPPVLMFSGSKGHTTENNILETDCFGVNFVDSSLATKVYSCIKWFGRERITKTGFTLREASKIEAPLINECKAHLECRFHGHKEVGSGYVIFGEIVAASIWEKIMKAETIEEKYKLLDQIVFLESKTFARINKISEIGEY